MFNSTKVMISACVEQLQTGYQCMYGGTKPNYAKLIGWAANLILENLAKGNAPYHNIEHTVLVTLAGQEILIGKHISEGGVGVYCEDWLHFIISLLCHDIGYVKGVCRQDQVNKSLYATGIDNGMLTLPADSTDASLAPYHVDRGKLFVEEHFSGNSLIDVEAIKRNIELTRFPVPPNEEYQCTRDYPGLARAADLIGQLSDPCYLQKITDLFEEFEEIGTNDLLGYHHPKDLLSGLPNFYRNQVHPYIPEAVQYLEVTPEGRQILANLYTNVQQTIQGRHQKSRKKYAGKDLTPQHLNNLEHETKVAVGCSG
jgi:hypothetical protein